jgi:hypothetical protein
MIKRRLFTDRKAPKERLAWPAALGLFALIGLLLAWRG